MVRTYVSALVLGLLLIHRIRQEVAGDVQDDRIRTYIPQRCDPAAVESYGYPRRRLGSWYGYEGADAAYGSCGRACCKC